MTPSERRACGRRWRWPHTTAQPDRCGCVGTRRRCATSPATGASSATGCTPCSRHRRPDAPASTVVGKLYRDRDQAREAAELMQRLVGAAGRPALGARPLAVADPAAAGAGRGPRRPPLRPADAARHGRHPVQPDPADGRLRACRRALADLHTSDTLRRRTHLRARALDEVGQGSQAGRAPSRHTCRAVGTTAADVAQSLARRWRRCPVTCLRPAHGSYKPSQLLFRAGLGLPRRLRPVLPRRPGAGRGLLPGLPAPARALVPPGRHARVVRAGRGDLPRRLRPTPRRARGRTRPTRTGIPRRCHVYEAALLLKIAARRPNRLHSPRPGEVACAARRGACLPDHRRLGVRGSGSPALERLWNDPARLRNAGQPGS